MKIRETFAANVRKRRKDAGLSQEKLAELAGLHRTYVGGIEQQRVNVSLKNIGRIADALGVEPFELFVGGEVDGREAWRQAMRESDELAGQVRGAGRAVAVATWDGDEVMVEPLEATFDDLTVQILVGLAAQGYAGDELARQYAQVSTEVRSFLAGSRA